MKRWKRRGEKRRGEERDKKEMRHQMQCEGVGSGWEGGTRGGEDIKAHCLRNLYNTLLESQSKLIPADTHTQHNNTNNELSSP